LGVGGQLLEPRRRRFGFGWELLGSQPGAAVDIDNGVRQAGTVDGQDSVPHQGRLLAAQAAGQPHPLRPWGVVVSAGGAPASGPCPCPALVVV
jgi:hypothetical protein